MTWATLTIPASCGGCGARLEAGARIAYYTRARLPRCTGCAERLGVYDDGLIDEADAPRPATVFAERVAQARVWRKVGA